MQILATEFCILPEMKMKMKKVITMKKVIVVVRGGGSGVEQHMLCMGLRFDFPTSPIEKSSGRRLSERLCLIPWRSLPISMGNTRLGQTFIKQLPMSVDVCNM